MIRNIALKIDLPEMDQLENLIKENERLSQELRNNISEIQQALFFLEVKMNQTAVEEPTGSEVKDQTRIRFLRHQG